MQNTEQFIAAQKANFETLFGLSGKAFEGAEKIIELNLQVAKAAMGEAAETARAALAVKDAQELVAFQAALLQPTAEKLAGYGRNVYEIASSTNADVGKAGENWMAEFQKKCMNMVETAMKNAPAGTENAVAMVKSAVTAANTAYESSLRYVKQANDAAEANIQAATATAVKATQAVSKTKR
jgi:phasin family protein